MSEMNERFIQRYQAILEKDPKSQVFAPLAEAYRKMGLVKASLDICKKGISHNVNFAGGYLVYGRLLIDSGEPAKAIEILFKAVELAPENVLAQGLLADTLLQAKRNKEALEALKMILFMNPKNEKVYKKVKELEVLTADEYEEEAFSMHPLQELEKELESIKSDGSLPIEKESEALGGKRLRILERYISLTDAFIVRNNMDKAYETLREAERLLGMQDQIKTRLQLLNDRGQGSIIVENQQSPQGVEVPSNNQINSAKDVEARSEQEYRLNNRVDICQSLLARISDRG